MWMIIIAFISICAAALVVTGFVLQSIMRGPPDDVDTACRPTAGLARRLIAWFTRKPERLDYRRDSRGRFRKVRRE